MQSGAGAALALGVGLAAAVVATLVWGLPEPSPAPRRRASSSSPRPRTGPPSPPAGGGGGLVGDVAGAVADAAAIAGEGAERARQAAARAIVIRAFADEQLQLLGNDHYVIHAVDLEVKRRTEQIIEAIAAAAISRVWHERCGGIDESDTNARQACFAAVRDDYFKASAVLRAATRRGILQNANIAIRTGRVKLPAGSTPTLALQGVPDLDVTMGLPSIHGGHVPTVGLGGLPSVGGSLPSIGADAPSLNPDAVAAGGTSIGGKVVLDAAERWVLRNFIGPSITTDICNVVLFAASMKAGDATSLEGGTRGAGGVGKAAVATAGKATAAIVILGGPSVLVCKGVAWILNAFGLLEPLDSFLVRTKTCLVETVAERNSDCVFELWHKVEHAVSRCFEHGDCGQDALGDFLEGAASWASDELKSLWNDTGGAVIDWIT